MKFKLFKTQGKSRLGQLQFNRGIVETIVTFAKSQNIATIAEYVENEEIFNLLNEIGVTYSQGYYFGPPKSLNNDEGQCNI